MATPAPPSGDLEADSLVFMTHAPGSVVPPRALEGIDVNDSFAGKILGKFGIKTNKEEEADSGESLTGRLAKGAAEGAGKGALDRALAASRRSTKREAAPPPQQEDPSWTDKTWAGQNIQVQDETPRVVMATPTSAPQASEPGFLGQLPGAIFTPLRGFVVTLVHVIIMGLALMLLELSSLIGVIACAVALAELVALRVRVIRETSAGRYKVGWPDVGGMLSALLPFIAASLVAIPALGVGAASYAPSGAFRGDSPASLQQRLKRIRQPIPIQAADAPEPTGVQFGQATYLMLEAAIGVVDRDGPSKPTRPTAEVADDLAASARLRAKSLIDTANATPLGIGGRVLAVLAFLYFPMAFLCAVRLRSAYAAVHVPLVLRSSLRVLGPYLVVLLVFGAQLAATAAALLLLPAHLANAGAGGHLVWVAVVALVLVAFPLMTSDLLGRLYRSRQVTLGWD